MKRPLLAFTLFLVLISGLITTVPTSAAASEVNRSVVDQEQQRGKNLAEKLGITETLGPLAPVALSPFFGLTCLSATSILCEKGILPENQFLMGNEVLNNFWVFLIFLGLTIVTSAPRLVSASKVFAEATERIETYAGIISYGVILMFAHHDAGAEQAQQAVVFSAGFFSMTGNGLLACCAAVNIFVIASVRFFFELLTLISPIPTLDAIFECTNKTIADILATIYAFNPWLAFVLNLILFLFCLVIFKWVNRRIRYMKALLLEPVLVGMVRSVLGRVHYDPDKGMLRKLRRQFGDVAVSVKCFPSRKLGKIKKKDRCHLVFGGEKLILAKPRLTGGFITHELNISNLSREIQEGLLSYSFVLHPEKGKECELIFGRVYTPKLDLIRSQLSERTGPAETENEPAF